MKAFFVCVITLLIFSCSTDDSTQEIPETIIPEAICDNGTFVGVVRLETQQEVDEFGAMCYSKIEGNLIIGQAFDTDNDITDLSSLETLTEIYAPENASEFAGALAVVAYNLTSLHGLHNITSVTSLRISDCNVLTDLSGISSLQEVTGITLEDSFEGVFWIFNNPQISSLEGLNNLTSIGLDSGDFFDVSIRGTGIQSLNGLNNVSSIKGRVTLTGLPQITTLEGLNSLEIVDRSLVISLNTNLLNFNGLDNLQVINGSLVFGANPSLLNIDGFSNLIVVQGSISTLDTPSCSNCSPLPIGNESLTDFCGLANLFTNGTFQADEVEIADNAYNPTVQDIVDGNCSM